MKHTFFRIIVPILLLLLAACSGTKTVGSTSTFDPVLISVAEKAVDELAVGSIDPVYALFDEAMVKAISKDQVAEFWPQLETQFGKYQGREGSTIAPYQVYQIVSVKTKFANDSIFFNIVFDKNGKIAGMNMTPATTPTPAAYTLPAYVDESKFSEQEVTVGSGKWALPGTLTLPKGDGPFPGVVLVHGSGPNDRDETIGPNRPFKDIAWGLASRGIAVLRYDKRTKTHAEDFSLDVLNSITLEDETIDDALLAADLLRKNPRIDPKQIYVLGHSQGGMAAPRIGEQDPNLAGLIILAGPTRPMEDILIDQLTYISNVDGTVSEAEKNSIEMAKTAAVKVKDPGLSKDIPSSELPLGIPASFWLDMRGYQPARTARELGMRLLVLQGGRDYQVTQNDYILWQEALQEMANATLVFFPDLNHLFITGEGMATPEEYSNPGTVAAEVIDQIATWVLNSSAK